MRPVDDHGEDRGAGIGPFLRQVIDEWQRDDALAHGAALAYYALFSMAPLLVIVVAIVGLVLGRAVAQGQLLTQITAAVGPDVGRVIGDLIVQTSSPASGLMATGVSLATIVLGATGLVGQLRHALNRIFGVATSAATGIRGHIRQRIVALGLILAIGGLLLASVVVEAAVGALAHVTWLPRAATLVPSINFAMSFLLMTALFALMYRLLPDIQLAWRDVWLGAAMTALLFTMGKTLIAVYLGRAGATSVYGAASSLVLLLVWVYYSAQLLLFGAEMVDVWSRRYGSRRGT